MSTKIISYYRVSTDKQGLGIDAQKAAVQAYMKSHDAVEIASFEEVESGTVKNRPALTRALAMCKNRKAVLCVAKLDRLARSCSFMSTLLESGTQFVACDNPFATIVTIQILSAINEDEARRIRLRTKEALAAAKAKGTLLGSARPNHWQGREHRRGWAKAALESARLRSEKARRERSEFAPNVSELLERGLNYSQVADALNSAGWTTPKGRPWNKIQVCKFVKACGLSKSEVRS